MVAVKTLPEILEKNHHCARNIIHFNGENDVRAVSFDDLYRRALGILFHLQRHGVRRSDKLILVIGNNEKFIETFWAAVMGGIVPVPVALGSNDHQRRKILRIAGKLGKPFICTDRDSIDAIAAISGKAEGESVFRSLRARAVLIEEIQDVTQPGELQRAKPDDLAFIQFSSGSTGEPKGVVITHKNLIANIRATTGAANLNANDVSLSWMPLTHDMGLIGFHLMTFANRMDSHFLPTERFVRRPLLWLELASRIRATLLCSPNFGYRHYLKLLGDRPVDKLDLSAVRIIFNGAESISVPLCEEFLTRLTPAKLSRTAMYPVYGLAEATLSVCFPPLGSPLKTVALNRHKMALGKPVEFLPSADMNAILLVSEGPAVPFCEVRITNDDDESLPESHIGHVQIRGENVTSGYYESPWESREAFTSDGWLRTGDLGFMHAGDLHVSGRTKDIIRVNGQNYFPSDLEAVAHLTRGLEIGNVIAAAVTEPQSQTIRLGIFIVHRGRMEDFLPLAAQVAQNINKHTGLEVFVVVPVLRIPKTTSGKIMRHALVKSFVDGEFDLALSELAALRAALRDTEVTSLTEIEHKLKRYCETSLQGVRVGVHDNLFEIGVSSMNLIQIHEQIARDYPGQVDLAELYNFPTIAELAKRLEGRLSTIA